MRSTILATFFAFAATTLALPQPNWSDWPKAGNGYGKNCLSDADVQTLVDGYTYLLEQPTGPQFNTTALSILSDKFAVWSDSIQSLANRPVSL